MASPLNARKKSVDMAAPVVRVSRIRRDPPATIRVVSAAEVRERETLTLVVGVLVFALALFVDPGRVRQRQLVTQPVHVVIDETR